MVKAAWVSGIAALAVGAVILPISISYSRDISAARARVAQGAR